MLSASTGWRYNRNNPVGLGGGPARRRELILTCPAWQVNQEWFTLLHPCSYLTAFFRRQSRLRSPKLSINGLIATGRVFTTERASHFCVARSLSYDGCLKKTVIISGATGFVRI